MNIKELIHEMLSEVGEGDLADRVSKKLATNDAAHEPFKVATDNGAREVDWLHFELGGLIGELE
jgi:hypothetical protein